MAFRRLGLWRWVKWCCDAVGGGVDGGCGGVGGGGGCGGGDPLLVWVG